MYNVTKVMGEERVMNQSENQIIKSYKEFWTRFVDVKGRSHRPDYWHPFWINMVISTILGALSGGILSSIFGLAIMIPSFTVMVRRLHDTNRSMLFAIISYVSGIIVMVAMFIFFFGAILAANDSSGAALSILFILGVLGFIAAIAISIYIIYLLVLPGDQAPNNYGSGGSNQTLPEESTQHEVQI